MMNHDPDTDPKVMPEANAVNDDTQDRYIGIVLPRRGKADHEGAFRSFPKHAFGLRIDAQRDRAMYGQPTRVPTPPSIIPMRNADTRKLNVATEMTADHVKHSIMVVKERLEREYPEQGKTEQYSGDLVEEEEPITEHEANALKLKLLRNPRDMVLRRRVDRLHEVLMDVAGERAGRPNAGYAGEQTRPAAPPQDDTDTDDDDTDDDGRGAGGGKVKVEVGQETTSTSTTSPLRKIVGMVSRRLTGSPSPSAKKPIEPTAASSSSATYPETERRDLEQTLDLIEQHLTMICSSEFENKSKRERVNDVGDIARQYGFDLHRRGSRELKNALLGKKAETKVALAAIDSPRSP